MVSKLQQHKARYFGLIVLIAIAIVAVVLSRPAKAEATLGADEGAAMWFFAACTDAEDFATSTIVPSPNDPTLRTVHIDTRNAYPGYQFQCELWLANTGDTPLSIADTYIDNSHPDKLAVQATAAGAVTLQPCGSALTWGTSPEQVPVDCRASISLDVTIMPDAEQNAQYGYTVHVSLQ